MRRSLPYLRPRVLPPSPTLQKKADVPRRARGRNLARSSGARGSDHALCNARFSPGSARVDNFYSHAYDFRGRRLRDPADVSRNSMAWSIGGVEVMCPLLDCRILDAFHKVVRTFDDRSDWACERVFNGRTPIAMEFEPHLPDFSCTLRVKLARDAFPTPP